MENPSPAGNGLIYELYCIILRRVNRKMEIAVRCAVLVILPIFPAAFVAFMWYEFAWKPGLHFNAGLEGIATTAWIPMFGILYSLLAAIVLSTVWAEYKGMRAAVKKYDVETFMNLRDEKMSPLVHTMMTMLSVAVLLAFMGLKYPDAGSGMLLIGSTAFLFSMIFFVVVEIDDPCSGIWVIKNIHKEWLEIDVKTWREKRFENARKTFFAEQGGIIAPK